MVAQAGRGDSSWYAQSTTGGRKYHVVVDRPHPQGRGPACGYPLHDEATEEPATGVDPILRCGRPGCRKAFTEADKEVGT